MTQLFSGIVLFQAEDEPYDSGYGLKYNVAITMDDPDAPKLKDGVLRVYRSPEHSETPLLKSLKQGDPVQLIYTDRGNRSYYSLIADASSPQNGQQSQQASSITDPVTVSPVRQPRKQEAQIWLPMTDVQTGTYLTIASQEQMLLSNILHAVEEQHPDKSEEIQWKLAVTIYIRVNQQYRPNLVVEELVEELLQEEPPF